MGVVQPSEGYSPLIHACTTFLDPVLKTLKTLGKAVSYNSSIALK